MLFPIRGAGHGHHAHGAHQLADAQQPEEDGVHRQRERVVERDLPTV